MGLCRVQVRGGRCVPVGLPPCRLAGSQVSAYLLSREYFDLAAMRFRPPAEAKAFRKANQTAVFTAGLLIAAFVTIPIVNLATPLFGMALMVHMHKKLSGRRLSQSAVRPSSPASGTDRR